VAKVRILSPPYSEDTEANTSSAGARVHLKHPKAYQNIFCGNIQGIFSTMPIIFSGKECNNSNSKKKTETLVHTKNNI